MAHDITLTVVGNLTGDPELRYTASGAAVTRFTVASTARHRDQQSGRWGDGKTVFLTCLAWEQLAENVAESLCRGTRVVVTGRLRQRTYDTAGQTRTVHELHADEVAPSLRFATATVRRLQRTTTPANGHPSGAEHPAD